MTARVRRPRSRSLPRPERSAIRLIGYARASREDAARGGTSLTSQRQRIRAYARAQQWELLGIDHVEQLPGVRWKLQNLAQLRKSNLKKFAEQSDLLAERLTAGGLNDGAPPPRQQE